MKKFIIAIVSAGLLTTGVFAEANLTVDFATAHIFRGVTITDDFVVQPGMELSGFGMNEKYGVFAAGVWGSTAPFNDDTPSRDSIYETDWYLNYALPQLVEGMDLYIQYTQYQYSFTPDEKELNFGIGYALGDFLLGATANFMIDDRNLLTENQKYFDFFADYEWELNEKSAVNAGGLIALMFQGDGYSAIGLDDGFNHYELDAAYSYAMSEMWSIGATIGYVGQLDSNVLPDAFYDRGLYAMLNLGCEL